MSVRLYRRRRSGNPALLRQLRGQPAIAAVDQAASPAERAFAALTTTSMLLVSVYLILTSLT